MDRIAPIPSSTLPVIAAKPIAYKDPVWVPLPEQDAVECNSLIAVKAWQSLFKGLPLEIVSMIFIETLWGLTITEILNIAEYQKGQLIPEAWPELYKASVLAFGSIEALPEWLSSPTQFRNFVEDAQKYGDKTLRQIFYGLQLLKKMEGPISIEEGMRAGIIRREHVCLENALPSIKAQQDFLSWLGEKKARMAVYLRWFPAQTRDPEDVLKPDLLKDAVKCNNCRIVKEICVYMKKHKLHDKDAFHACRRALREAVMRSDVEIAEYLLDEFPEGRRAQGILQTAAKKGCLPMVQVLLEKKVEINALDDYQKTALQAVIDAFYPFEIFSLYSEYDGKKYQKAFDQLEVIIFLLRQYVDKKLAFNINWELREKNTFLHMACYVQDPDSALWLAQFILEQQKDKNLLKAQNADGKSPFICAYEAGNHLMYTFLHEQWAKRVPEIELSPSSLQELQALRKAAGKASPTIPSTKPVLPAPITIQNAPSAAVQPLPITASYTPSVQEISRLHTWVQTFVDFSKYLLAIVFFIPHVLYTFYLKVIRTLVSRVEEK